MVSQINVLCHIVAAAVLFAAGSGVSGQSRSVSAVVPLDNAQDSVADLDPFAANGYYPATGAALNPAAVAAAAAAMDAVDMLDMERPVLPPLTRSQLQRLLRNALFLNPPGAGTGGGLDSQLPFTGNVNTLAAANSAAGPAAYGMLPVPLPYGARMLRMRMPQMPEMKRTARGRSMQCYFNPISCY